MPGKSAPLLQPTIIAHAPCRADLAGGTIDLWPLYLFHPGALTLNFALEILTTCRVTPLKGQRIELCSIDTGCNETFANLGGLISRRSRNFGIVRVNDRDHGRAGAFYGTRSGSRNHARNCPER